MLINNEQRVGRVFNQYRGPSMRGQYRGGREGLDENEWEDVEENEVD